MRNELVRRMASNAIVAALYFALTLLVAPIAFSQIQIRISEFLVLICFFRKDYAIGLTIGCALANLFSPMMPWDLVFGTIATLIACVGIMFCKHLFIATLCPVIANGFIIAWELNFVYDLPYWVNVGWVALGELISVSVVGYIIFMLLKKNKRFFELIGRNQNENFEW